MQQQKKQRRFPRPLRHTETSKHASTMVRDFYRRALIYGKTGKQVAWSMAGTPIEVLELFDVATSMPENYGALCAAAEGAIPYLEIAESKGYAIELCSYMRTSLGYSAEFLSLGDIPPDAPAGGMAKPTAIISNTFLCDPRTKALQAMATMFKVPMFLADSPCPPHGTDPHDEKVKSSYIKHSRDELWGLIAFLEKLTGEKYNPDRLRELVTQSQEANYYWYQVGELRKTVPCPYPSQDYFHAVAPYMFMAGYEMLDLYRHAYTEVKYRADHKMGIIPEERFRILTVGIPPWYNMAIFNYLENLGMVCVMDLTYTPGRSCEVDLSDPIQALVERAWAKGQDWYKLGAEFSPEPFCMGLPPGTYPDKLILSWIDEYKVDGVLMFYTPSCRALAFGQNHWTDLLNERGVPVLSLEEDMADPRAWDDTLVKEQINAFRDVLEARRRS